MERQVYLDLAASGLRMPIGTDLLLHEQPDPASVLRDGQKLGRVLEEAALHYNTPLAFGLMDLTLEKTALLELLGIAPDLIDKYHFSEPPTDQMLEMAADETRFKPNPRLQAHIEAMEYLAERGDMIPVGMVIGPFSLMTKLVRDPIVPVYMAGSGKSGDNDKDVRTVERLLAMGLEIVLASARAQIRAGARAVFVAEPAANQIYISPKQMNAGSEIFDRFVLRPNRILKSLLDEEGVDLIFHCCGEITTPMLEGFCTLDPVILSLGSSRKLWEDAAIVPKTTVLFGNLPSKMFWNDSDLSADQVRRMTEELAAHMRDSGHPHILGTECDVLSVKGSEATIKSKVEAMMEAGKMG